MPDGVYENVHPAEVTVQRVLQEGLEAWALMFDGTLDTDSPADSGFETVREREMFTCWGRALALSVANEHHRNVIYYDRLFSRDTVVYSGQLPG